MAPAASAHDDLANAVFRVGVAVWVLRSVTFVGMLMPDQHQVGMSGIEVQPKLLQLRMVRVAFEQAAAEQGVVAVSNNARVWVLAQVLAQPHFLGGAGAAASQARRITVGV